MASPVTEEVIQDLLARDTKGWKEYGQALAPFSKKDALLEAYEEALDLAQYLKLALIERDAQRGLRPEHRWGYAPKEKLSADALIAEEYRGIRPAPGYPAQPDHTEKATIFRLLDAEAAAGIRLTESYAMWPGAAVSRFPSHRGSASCLPACDATSSPTR